MSNPEVLEFMQDCFQVHISDGYGTTGGDNKN
jgi:hypothetical protein